MAFSGPGVCMSIMKPMRILSLLTIQGQNFKSIEHYKASISSYEYGKFLWGKCGSLSNTMVSGTLYLVNCVLKAFVTLPVVLAMLSTSMKLL